MAEPRKRNTGRPGSLSLVEALQLAGRNFEASQQQAEPFNFGESVRGADKAIQQGVFGAVDAIGSEGKRLIDGKFGFDALAKSLPKLMDSGPSNLAAALATSRAGRSDNGMGKASLGGAQWANQDLQAQRDRDNLGKAGGGALDASMLLPGAGLVPKMGKSAGMVFNEVRAAPLAKRLKDVGGTADDFLAYYDEAGSLGDAVGANGKQAVGRALEDYIAANDVSYKLKGTARPEPLKGIQNYATADVPFKITRDGGGFSIKTKDGLAGAYGRELNDKVTVLDRAAVNESMRGKGIGTAMFERAAEEAAKKGKILVSDGAVTDEAARVFDVLERRGYNVLRAPNIEKVGKYNKANGDPVFAILPPNQKGDWYDVLGAYSGQPVQRPAPAPLGGVDWDRISSSASDPTTLGMGFPFGGKDGEKPLFNVIRDAFKGKPKESPLDQFTPPTTLDDIFTGGAPRGPRELSGGTEYPAGLDSSFMNDPRFNGAGVQDPVPYDPAKGFQGLDARFASDKNAKTLSEALAKRAKPPGYDDWSPEWRAAYDKGLDMSQEARMARAREQGYTTPVYHGTYQDFDAFDTNISNGDVPLGTHLGLKPEQANSRLISNSVDGVPSGERVMPLLTNIKNPVRISDSSRWTANEVAQQLESLPNPIAIDMPTFRIGAEDIRNAVKGAGHDGMIYDNVFEGGGDSLIAFDPANIRSTSAAFDPANAGKPTLLGAGPPAFDAELLKLLMAYGAFGGMSAGALATIDAQKHQQGGM